MKMDPGQSVARAPDFDTQVEITNTVVRHFLGSVTTEGSIDTIRHGVADANRRSPRTQYRMEGGTTAMNVKAVSASDGSSPRIEITNTSDSYGEIRASAHTLPSSAVDKDQIVDLNVSALSRARTMRPRRYRRISRAGQC